MIAWLLSGMTICFPRVDKRQAAIRGGVGYNVWRMRLSS
jgi:hypothetical protein